MIVGQQGREGMTGEQSQNLTQPPHNSHKPLNTFRIWAIEAVNPGDGPAE